MGRTLPPIHTGEDLREEFTPPTSRLKTEMPAFFRWFNGRQEIDDFLKAGLAHFMFVTIHTFADGNGRIAHAVGDMMLACA